ncbi:MAG: DNA-3-methyladenine glycosylase [Myxococcota bacterium]
MKVQNSMLCPEFYARDALIVAKALLGQWIQHREVTLRITETEAYCGPQDSACHARCGKTRRNAAMWGPAGCAYVYLCYGLHHMLNVVTGQEGVPEAVLIRACEVVQGLAVVRGRRRGLQGPTLLTGPGKVGQALQLDCSFSHQKLFEQGGLVVRRGENVRDILVGPRVGISYAQKAHREALWRFAVANSPWVSQRHMLRPLQAAASSLWRC